MSNLTVHNLAAGAVLAAALAVAPIASAGPAAKPASAPQGAGAAASAPAVSTSKIGIKKPIVPADKIKPGAAATPK